MKECRKCKRELPMNTDYYFKKCDTKDGFMSRCKECQGSAFSNHLTKNLPQDGYKFCIKCDRELQVDIKFFPPDKLCVDGLRNVCRECGKDGHFMESGYIPKEFWTDNEHRFFSIVYPHYTTEELISLFYSDCIGKDLWDKAYRLGGIEKTKETIDRSNVQKSIKTSGENNVNYGKPMKEETKIKLSLAKKGKYVGLNNKLFGIPKTDEHKRNMSIAFRKIGKWKGNNNPRHINPLSGELNGRWEGGLTSKGRKIRNSEEYKNWRLSVFIRDGFTCQCCENLRGKLEAHHIENFSSNEEMRFDLENGITMCKECHNPTEYYSFHYIYGTRNNTKNQLDEYILRYKNGEFKEVS